MRACGAFHLLQRSLDFWIASVSVIMMYSTFHKAAFANTFLYLFGMTLAFYGLKYLSELSLLCGLGSAALYFWNKSHWYSGGLYTLPSGTLAAFAAVMFRVVYQDCALCVKTSANNTTSL